MKDRDAHNFSSQKIQPLSAGAVLEQTLFLAPACAGLVILGLALLFGSSYQWILISAYALGLPLLFFYVRNRPPPQNVLGPRQVLTEMAVSLASGDLQDLGKALARARGDANLDDLQVERANLQYQATNAVFRQFCYEVENNRPLRTERGERVLSAGQKCLSALFDDLRVLLECFDRLRGFKTAQLLKKSQYSRDRARVETAEISRSEQAHRDQLSARSDIFGEVLSHLDHSEKLAAELLALTLRLQTLSDAGVEGAIREFEKLAARF